MSVLRIGPRMAALAALTGLVLGALLAGGCSAPTTSERAEFGVVTGFVVDTDGRAVAGARVMIVDAVPGAVVGTRNYLGSRGPFVTNASGQFSIQGIQRYPGNPVVLNLEASHPNFVPAAAKQRVNTTADVQLGGTTLRLVQGTEQRDIVVADAAVSGVVAMLTPLGASAAVSVEGAEIATEVPGLGTATISFPAGAVTTPRTFAATGLDGIAVSGATGGMPSAIPAASAVAPPVVVVPPAANQTATVDAVVPLVAVDIRSADGSTVQFPAGRELTVALPLPVTLSSGDAVPVIKFAPATTPRSRTTAGGGWVLVGEAVVTSTGFQATFRAAETGLYAAVVNTRWTLGTAAANGEVVELPPLANATSGYSMPFMMKLQFPLHFQEGAPMLQFLRSAYAAVVGQPAQGNMLFTVPQGGTTGLRVAGWERPVTVDVQLSGRTHQFDGSRLYWESTTYTTTPVTSLPEHLQGHAQGGGIER